MNTILLRTVAEHIAAEPRRLDMDFIKKTVDMTTPNAPPCGTVGCIAGWACILSGPDEKRDEDMWARATELLDLSPDEADRLFTEPASAVDNEDSYNEDNGWPLSFAQDYEDAETPKERADVTVRRIDRFIETSGEV